MANFFYFHEIYLRFLKFIVWNGSGQISTQNPFHQALGTPKLEEHCRAVRIRNILVILPITDGIWESYAQPHHSIGQDNQNDEKVWPGNVEQWTKEAEVEVCGQVH